MSEEGLTIKIDILQRPYSVRVKREDEELFRQAGASIEQSIQRYASKGVTYRDKQDLLAMALLETTVMSLLNKQKEELLNQTNNAMNRLKDLNEFLTLQIDVDKQRGTDVF